MRIAVIDNDSFLLTESCKVIKKVRTADQVYAFDEGLKLLEFIIENPCEVIFMDPYLDDMDGGILAEEIKEILCEIDEEIGIGLKAGIGRGKNAEDAAYMADIGLEEIRDRNNEPWTWVVEKLE